MSKELATQVRRLLREAFPNCRIVVTVGTYNYIRHTDSEFGKRELPAVLIDITGKDFHYAAVSGRRVYHDPELDAVLTVLRAAGLCAETHNRAPSGACVLDAPRDQWPINKVYRIGDWHTLYPAEATNLRPESP
jgi:hypothetical protein